MELTVLGSGTCAVTRERSCSSYLLKCDEKRILIDIGFGAMRRMAQAGIDYREIDAIVCSHFHLDHVGDLSPFFMATRYTPGFQRQKPLIVIGPEGFKSFLSACRDLFGDWLLPTDDYPFKIVELNAEQYRLGECLIQALPMNHSRPTNGYRIDHHGVSCVYSGDTGPCDELVTLANNADVALFECSFPDDQPFDFHLTPKQAGQMAQQAHVKKLLLTHFYPLMDNVDVIGAVAPVFDGEVELAEDFKVLEI